MIFMIKLCFFSCTVKMHDLPAISNMTACFFLFCLPLGFLPVVGPTEGYASDTWCGPAM